MKHLLNAAALALTATTLLNQPASAMTDALAHRLSKPEFHLTSGPRLTIDALIGETSTAERAPFIQIAGARKRNRRFSPRRTRRPVVKPRRFKKRMINAHKGRRNGAKSVCGDHGDPSICVAFDFAP